VCRFPFVSPPLSSLHLFYSTRRLWQAIVGAASPWIVTATWRAFRPQISSPALFYGEHSSVRPLRKPEYVHTHPASAAHVQRLRALPLLEIRQVVSLDSRCHGGPHSRRGVCRKAVKLALSNVASSTRSALIKPWLQPPTCLHRAFDDADKVG